MRALVASIDDYGTFGPPDHFVRSASPLYIGTPLMHTPGGCCKHNIENWTTISCMQSPL